MAFQVRIKPGCYDVSQQTIGAKTDIDPLFSNSELEWSTKRRHAAMLVGLLVKIEGVHHVKYYHNGLAFNNLLSR